MKHQRNEGCRKIIEIFNCLNHRKIVSTLLDPFNIKFLNPSHTKISESRLALQGKSSMVSIRSAILKVFTSSVTSLERVVLVKYALLPVKRLKFNMLLKS